MEHTSGGKADVIEGARESLLAASVSHPNVIPCYKVGGLTILDCVGGYRRLAAVHVLIQYASSSEPPRKQS